MSDEPCLTCNGSGYVDEVEYVGDEMQIVSHICHSCGGTGRA